MATLIKKYVKGTVGGWFRIGGELVSLRVRHGELPTPPNQKA